MNRFWLPFILAMAGFPALSAVAHARQDPPDPGEGVPVCRYCGGRHLNSN